MGLVEVQDHMGLFDSQLITKVAHIYLYVCTLLISNLAGLMKYCNGSLINKTITEHTGETITVYDHLINEYEPERLLQWTCFFFRHKY